MVTWSSHLVVHYFRRELILLRNKRDASRITTKTNFIDRNCPRQFDHSLHKTKWLNETRKILIEVVNTTFISINGRSKNSKSQTHYAITHTHIYLYIYTYTYMYRTKSTTLSFAKWKNLHLLQEICTIYMQKYIYNRIWFKFCFIYVQKRRKCGNYV